MVYKISVNSFKTQLIEEIANLEVEKSYKSSDGYGFQLWCAELLKKNNSYLEPEAEDAMTFGKSDLKVDLVFEDPARKYGIIVQCKFRGFKNSSLINETEINDFFSRHTHFMDRDWIKKHGSDQVVDLLLDYNDKIKNGYKFDYFFLTTARKPTESARIDDLIKRKNASFQERGINIECFLYDFSGLKELYVVSQSLDDSPPDSVEVEIQEGNFFERDKPYPTIIASIKGNTLINIFNRYGISIFQYNIREFLGDRNINNTIKETAKNDPGNFFYFNNGISAICTGYCWDQNLILAEGFQIINGAQTVGALIEAGFNDQIRVLFRLTKTKSVKTESGINSQIIQYNNTQNSITISDFKANDPIQKWLEIKFKEEKLHSSLGHYSYKRKRNNKKAKRGRTSISLEEFGKIRYAFLYEPTLVSGSTKALWTNKSEGGVYNLSFGINGEIEDLWPNEIFRQSLVAILCYKKIEQVTKILARSNKNFTQMVRLKYYILRLMAFYLAQKCGLENYKNLLDNKQFFDDTWEDFWGKTMPLICFEYTQAVKDSNTPFALARNEQSFKRILETFKSVFL